MISLILSLVSILSTPPDQRCVSTKFGYLGDKWAGGNALFLGRPVDPKRDVGIAHRDWPGHARVLVRNDRNGRWAVARVVDRGPYGITKNGRWSVAPKQYRFPKRHPRYKPLPYQVGRWRGCADLTPRLARKLRHSGRDRVSLWLLGR